jgi:hypothetical protein
MVELDVVGPAPDGQPAAARSHRASYSRFY